MGQQRVYSLLFIKICNAITAQRCRSETEKIFWRIFLVQYCHDSKNITPPPGNLKLSYLDKVLSLKLRISMEKKPFNFT